MIWNQSVQRRSAATRVYEQWHGESLSCRTVLRTSVGRGGGLCWDRGGGDQRRCVGRAHTCLGHLSQACAVVDLGLRHPRCPSAHQWDLMVKWLLDSETGRFCYDRNAPVYTIGKSCSRASKWYAAQSKTQIFRGVTVDLPRDEVRAGFVRNLCT